jgi:predicted ATPase
VARAGSHLYVANTELQGQQNAVNLYLSRVPVVYLKVRVHSREQFDEQVSPQSIQAPAMEITPMQLTALRVDSLRLLRSVELSLEPGFTVIVGPNQSGKSTVLDALQLLAEAARGELAEGLARRGGLGVLRSRSSTGGVQLEAELRSAMGQRLRYRLRLGTLGTYDFTVAQEELAEHVQGAWAPIFTRKGTQALLASGAPLSITEGRQALLSQLGPLAPPITRQAQASLAAIAVYPYFRTGAAWADPEAVPMRQPARLEPGVRLERTGSNLAAALYTLKEEHPEDWQDFMDITRLAFPSLKELRLPAVARGRVQLTWVDTSLASFDASELSDGTLSFLAMLCALFQPGSALIAIEEPEQHLHPDALMRLMGAARSLSVRQPIVFTTQSDTLMGLLDDIPESVVVARREEGETRLVRPGVEDFREWLKGFSLRDMRRELEGWDTEPTGGGAAAASG